MSGQHHGDWIGARLRRAYGAVESEPLPEDMLILLDRIADADRGDADDEGKGGA